MNEYKKHWKLKSDDGIKPGLQAIRQALVKVGNPEHRLKIIHVTGTNSKGSTIAFMEAILKELGLSTGVFSSPAIFDIHDQIRIDGKPISEAELNKTFEAMKDAGLSGMLTDFELLTVAAFVTFERLGPQYVLLETGMGGLLDSTNVVTPLVSVITTIALDHTLFLGSTIEEVAGHKAGIVKEGVPIVTGLLEEQSLEIVRTVAKEKGSSLFIYGEQSFETSEQFLLTKRKMLGEHQKRNAAVAIEALRVGGIALNDQAIKKGVATAQLALRFEEISPNVYVDGAHNPAAARTLAETIRTVFPGEKVDFVIGMLKGKDIKNTLKELIPVAASFTFITFSHSQAATGEELMNNCEFAEKSVANINTDTILLVKDENRKKVVTGSLYLLASLLN